MPRKPVNERGAGHYPGARQDIWDAIRRLPERFTIVEILDNAPANRDTAESYVAALRAADIVECVQEYTHTTPSVYRLRGAVGEEAPRVNKRGELVTMGLGREAMWRTIPIIKDFTATDLAAHASTDVVTVSPVDAKSYLGFLNKAGYIRVARKGGPGKPARYRFVAAARTGPLPPQIQRIKTVWDPNLKKIVWPEGGR